MVAGLSPTKMRLNYRPSITVTPVRTSKAGRLSTAMSFRMPRMHTDPSPKMGTSGGTALTWAAGRCSAVTLWP
jgi:hypothetical protein